MNAMRARCADAVEALHRTIDGGLRSRHVRETRISSA